MMSIADIFRKVQTGFRYVPDIVQYGEIEVWRAALTGDCEDFALSCRALCRQNGIESRLVMCFTETKEMHCVLACDEFILDNRQKELVHKDDLNYKWLAISGYNKGDDWRAIK